MRLFWAGSWTDRLRLWSGLVLFAFVLTHYLNHALGLVGLGAMEAFQHERLFVTRSLPGAVVLRGAFLIHLALALLKLGRLRAAPPPGQAAQMLSGFVIPLMLMPHLFVAGVRSGARDDVGAYPAVLADIYPDGLLWQTALLLLVWLHACVGLHFWLRGEVGYRRLSHLLAALAALVPALALAGSVAGAREAGRSAALSAAQRARWLDASHVSSALVYLIVAGVLAWLLLRVLLRSRTAEFLVVYEGGPVIRAGVGATLLDISRQHRVPHLSVCGGKARCSTCRVRILAGGQHLPPPEEAEARLLGRIGAAEDIRLACQTRPSGSLSIARVVKPETHVVARALVDGGAAAGVVREAAVLFIDIRGFTRLSETKLAFDVVFILNSFFSAAAQAIEANGGKVDKFMGDGMMAVFDSADGLPRAARAALAAVIAVDAELAEVNARLGSEIESPLRLGMGLHAGRLVVGKVGWGPAAAPTVVGRVVNLASRLEALAKQRNVELAMSRECAEFADLTLDAFPTEEVEVRGLDDRFPVVWVEHASLLTFALRSAEPGAALDRP